MCLTVLTIILLQNIDKFMDLAALSKFLGQPYLEVESVLVPWFTLKKQTFLGQNLNCPHGEFCFSFFVKHRKMRVLLITKAYSHTDIMFQFCFLSLKTDCQAWPAYITQQDILSFDSRLIKITYGSFFPYFTARHV